MSDQSVVQSWVNGLPLMQQAVLMTAVRGPDGIRKDHVAKMLLRWYRRCIFLSAFTGGVMGDPYSDDGGSFTGPSLAHEFASPDIRYQHEHHWPEAMTKLVADYLHCTDELPHHFQLHFMHGAEILGYKHPIHKIKDWWGDTYARLVADMHLIPEPESMMDWRLGDNEQQWREAERDATADRPGQSRRGADGLGSTGK